MVAYQYRIDVGYPGTINRVHDASVVAEVINTTTPPLNYGCMVSMDAATGTIRVPAATDTAAMFSGMYVRPYVTQGGGPVSPIVNDPLYTSTPPNAGVGNVLKRGFMSVRLNAASPAVVKGQAVGVFIGAATAGNPTGGVTGAAVSATVLAVPASYFMGPADANGYCEIAYNL
jgi:hypothetical protein